MQRQDKKYQAIFFQRSGEDQLFQLTARFRKRLFVDHCGWDLQVTGDLEIDEFDNDQTVYCAVLEQNEVIAMFRACRADGPYLSESVFPQLATTRAFPRDSNCWEISRFGVQPGKMTLRYSRIGYALMFHFAVSVQARALVATADLTYERFLQSLGIRSRRYGRPQIIGYDVLGKPIEVVAGEIPMNQQDNPAFTKILTNLKFVEIKDAAHVLGPARISA